MRRQVVAVMILVLLGQSLSNLNNNSYNNHSLDSIVIGESKQNNATLRLTDIDSPNVIDIFAGGYNSCFVNSDSELYCWGEESQGIPGVTDGIDPYTPAKVNFGREEVKAVDLSSIHACSIVFNGDRVKCWGNAGNGQIGPNHNSGAVYNPVTVDLYPRTAKEITVGSGFSCALLDNGFVNCWGQRANGKLGDGQTTGFSGTPVNVSILPTGLNVTSIDAGISHTCAIMNDSNVFCWGYGPGGFASAAGISFNFGNNIPVSITSGNGYSCVILDNGSVNCWGYKNEYGQLGINSTRAQLTPQYVDLGLGRTAKSLSIYNEHVCAILDDNSLKCWGQNGDSGHGGYLGLGHTTSPILVPTSVNIPPGRIIKSVQTGIYHTCVLFTDSSIECFGSNERSQLGNLGGNGGDIDHITNSISPISTPGIVEEVIENQFVNLSFRSERVLDFPLFDYQYNLDLPSGLTFNNSTFIISGTAQYTNQVNWNFSIGNGSVYYNGTYQLQILSDTDGDGISNKYDDNDDDDPWFDELDGCPIVFGNSTIDVFGCVDSDGDGYSDQGDKFPQDSTQQIDSDQDGYGDNTNGNLGDDCPRTYGTSNRNSTYGCEDSDFDGWADFEDEYVNDSSQWRDTDNDGYGDELNGFQGDACPKSSGTSTQDRFGCRDTDNDGWSDIGDALPENPTQWIDRDGDGYGENNSEKATEIDLFPSDGTQWNDTDSDGHGDNPYGTQGDWFPSDPTRWMDSDRDATADEDDAFPNDGTQQVDSDGDGYGDNIDGNRGDVFPDDPLEWKDSDDDGLGDNADMFPYDPTQKVDRDGDGMGDNPMGIGADKFPDDPTQWGDIDGDGYGDNQTGTNPDKFITDATQWDDRDGDGYGDNPQGRLYDLFPNNPTQWEDADEDGIGDNQFGTDSDPFLNDFDNDGYNDSIDILPKLASPGDLDADECLDEVDAFPENPLECLDTDGDGIGNQADSDDDGDGWTDADEDRLGTDSLSSSDTPVDSFEIVIPGTAVGLGAWDLIGMFGGIPLFIWIGFGFATRNGRCAKYEDLLNSANSRDELEQVALRWEYSLMLRMLGPHQGIRLERLRAELDDKFENATYDETEIGYDQTSIVENEGKDIPPINESFAGPTKETAATSTNESGYEWFKQGEENWYRTIGSDDEWLKFDE